MYKFVRLRTQKEHYIDNKEHIQEMIKQYYENHKEEIAAYNKQNKPKPSRYLLVNQKNNIWQVMTDGVVNYPQNKNN